MSTEEFKYKCSYPACTKVLSVNLEDELGNHYCAEHFQQLLKAKNKSSVKEETNTSANEEKKLLFD